jgi:hypothetical protein
MVYVFYGCLLLVSLGLGGCQSRSQGVKSAPASPIATATQSLDGVLGQGVGLSSVKMVEIDNDWNGYSDITPIKRHYKLWNQKQQLVGQGTFAAGGHGGYGIRQQYQKKITIPAPLAQKFWQTLLLTKVVAREQYQPQLSRREDYPDITIRLQLADRSVVFHSRSQGQYHTPWQVRIKTGDRQSLFVAQGGQPAQALQLLQAQLQHPGLEQAILKQRRPSQKLSAPSPKKS